MKCKTQKVQKQNSHGLWIKILAAPLCLVLALVFLYALERLADINQEGDPTTRVQVMIKDIMYNQYGLENNQLLSEEPIEEKNGTIRYSDRYLVRFQGEDDDIRHAEEIVSAMRRQYPEIRDFYMLPIPPRIVTEEGYEEERQKYLAYMEAFEDTFVKTAQVVDVLPALEAEAEQYLFFRTEDSWTARGAYYGSRELCKALGIEPFVLEAYDEHMYTIFSGSLYQIFGQSELDEGAPPGDPVYYYALPDTKNRETLVTMDGRQYKRPVFSSSASGLDTFVGTGQYVVIDGDEKNEETKDSSIMLICDPDGRLLAPFLANYYETVFVVNIYEYTDFSKDFPSILSNYGIEDIVWAQTSQNMGRASKANALNRFAWKTS